MAPEALEVYKAVTDTMQVGGNKYGTMMLLGTGGSMKEGGTLAAFEMFYNPEAYDILSFEDKYEYSGRIAYFIPTYYIYNDCRDENGILDLQLAKSKLQQQRKLKSNTPGLLSSDVQNNPVIPSEAFLSGDSNLFPSLELKQRAEEIIPYYKKLYTPVDLYYKNNKVDYMINTKTAVDTFPYGADNKEGTIIIYEFPEQIKGTIPNDAYIIGHDPQKVDTAEGSLSTIYVLKSPKYFAEIGHNQIVAEYVGRPYMGREKVNEHLLKLSLFYGNAKVFYENNVGTVKEYFEKHKALHLLSINPKFNSSNINKTINSYGYSIGNKQVKEEAMMLVRTWLLDQHSSTKFNYDLIPSLGLIQELMMFNFKGNFDRIMGFAGCIIGLNEMYNKYKDIEQVIRHNSLDYSFLHKNFNENRISNSTFEL